MFLTKIKKLIISLFLFLLILSAIYISHINFFYVDVIFYSAIFDGLLAAIITVYFLKYKKYFIIFSFFEKILIFIICLLLGYSFAISVPTLIDRSLSFYILEKIKEKGGGIQEKKFEELFSKEYMIEHQLVKVRLTEQLVSGTIIIENNCVKLTKFGETLAFISQHFRKHFLAKNRLLSGKYTSELTEILKFNSKNNKNLESYKCK
jgi:hypothetical protein